MNDWLSLLVLGLLLPLVVNEFGDVSQWLASRILLWGARRLGEVAIVERYVEEWQADLECVPGRLTKLGFALGVVIWGVPRLRLQIRLRRRRQQKEGGIEVAAKVADVTTASSWDGLVGIERHAVCLAAAKRGDKRAFDVLIADFTPFVWHVARSNGLDRTSAEDVVQDVWLELLHNLVNVVQPHGLSVWLITTTRRFARQRQGERREIDTNQCDPDPGGLDTVRRSDSDRALWTAFRQLPTSSQELLRLTVIAGRDTYDVIAIELGLDTEQVFAAKKEALAELRRLYSREMAREGLWGSLKSNKTPNAE